MSNNKLGYTWYPKDFISDLEVMFMSAAERGVYRDLIDLAYMNDNEIRYTKEMLAKYTNSDIETIEKVLALKGKIEAFGYSIPSCQKRMGIIERNRANGANGGRPKNENSTNNQSVDNPKNPNKTQSKNDSKIENRIKRETIFYNELIPFVETDEKLPNTYPKEMVREFFEYWSEPTPSGIKMRKENEKSWDLSRRLQRWHQNIDKFTSKSHQNQNPQNEQPKSKKRIEEQAKQLFGE